MSPPFPLLGRVRCVTAIAALLTIAATGFLPVTAARAGGYRFTNIADTTDGYTNIGAPSINDLGVVVFGANTVDQRYVIQTWDGDNIFTLYDEEKFSSFFVLNRRATINNAGTVAFFGRVNDSRGIFTGDGGPLTNIANADSGPLSGAGFGLVSSLNNSDSVALHGWFPADESNGIFVADGGPVATIARAKVADEQYLIPALNDFGEVACAAYRGYPGDHGFVFYDDGTRRTTLLESRNAGLGEVVVMNNLGQVVVVIDQFVGRDTISTLSIVSSEGVTRLADSDGAFAGFFASFSHSGINDHGDVAFHATLDDGRDGIFTGPDVASNRVIVEGDTPLFGVPIEDIFFAGALNESGQIAFQYTLITGIRGIAMATPILDVPGDTNGDGLVDVNDLNNVRNFFGAMGPDDGTLDGDAYPFDGLVNIDDLNAVRNNFGAEGAAVPEPGNLLAMVVGYALLGFVNLRRRNCPGSRT